MATNLVLSGLVHKRAEMAGRIEHARSELDGMLANLAALDATLRLFDPEIRLDAIRPKPYPPVRGPHKPGMKVREVLGALRETGQPMATQEIAARLMGAQAADRRAVAQAGEIVGAALRKLRVKGMVAAEREMGTTRKLWRLAGE